MVKDFLIPPDEYEEMLLEVLTEENYKKVFEAILEKCLTAVEIRTKVNLDEKMCSYILKYMNDKAVIEYDDLYKGWCPTRSARIAYRKYFGEK